MSGYRLAGSDTKSAKKIKEFVSSWNNLVGGMDILENWRRVRICYNLGIMNVKKVMRII